MKINKIFRLNSRQEGFTLLELLVVIAIIGLLSTIAVTSLNSARGKARDTKRLGDMKGIRVAQEYYYDDTNGYGCLTAGKVSACNTLATYINLATVEDSRYDAQNACTASSNSGCDYGFAVPASGEGFKVYFWLENATESLPAGLSHSTAQGLFD